MQPTWTVWTTLLEVHLGIILLKYGQNPMSGFRGEVVLNEKVNTLTHLHTHALMDDGQKTVTKTYSEHFFAQVS